MSIKLKRIFGDVKPVVAMVHLGALPGSPLHDREGGLAALVEGARKDLHALQDADIIFYDDLVSPDILDRARRDAAQVAVGRRSGKPGIGQSEINRLMIAAAREGQRVVRLKGGDAFIFGRGGEEIEALREAGVPYAIVPGITVVQDRSVHPVGTLAVARVDSFGNPAENLRRTLTSFGSAQVAVDIDRLTGLADRRLVLAAGTNLSERRGSLRSRPHRCPRRWLFPVRRGTLQASQSPG